MTETAEKTGIANVAGGIKRKPSGRYCLRNLKHGDDWACTQCGFVGPWTTEKGDTGWAWKGTIYDMEAGYVDEVLCPTCVVEIPAKEFIDD